MKNMIIRNWLLILAVSVGMQNCQTARAEACPFCTPTMTISEQFSKADAIVLATFVSAEAPSKDKLGSTTYEIVQTARGPAKWVEKGKQIVIERHRPGKVGDLFILLGSRFRGDSLDWGSPTAITESAFKFLSEAPGFESPAETRLAYYLKFLENSDPVIAEEAYGEFANAPYKDVAGLSKHFSPDSLRKWIKDSKTNVVRVNLYSMMLGLCGDERDARMFEERILDRSTEIRLSINGMMGGYLLLSGERGLEVLEKQMFLDKTALFSDTYSAMQALRFMWDYGKGKISADRLKASARLLLDRPDISDLVISDLARWKDWSIMSKLRSMYELEEYNIPTVKRSIIRYMIASTKDLPAGGGEQPGKHVAEGTRYLEELRKIDPKYVGDAEKYYFIF